MVCERATPQNSHIVVLFFEDLSKFCFYDLKCFCFVVTLLLKVFEFLNIGNCRVLHLNPLVAETELSEGYLRHEVERWKSLIEFLENSTIFVLHLAVKLTCIVSTTASNERVRREKFLDLIVSRLHLNAVLIELLLVHVLCNFFSKFVHFYNYY